ncbi:MAG TPA: creatininase family protein [Solirubrobacteraceae bacterium]|nr:creatininase family protein [Solirubrobacteraceae bacterium]
MAQLRVRAGREGARLSVHELELLSAPALRRLLEHGTDTVIVPFGSVEDQNGHLPLGADSLLADLAGREVAARLDAVLAPTVRVGAGPTGTLGVEDRTLTETAVALASRLADQGFRLIVLLPIHGGNVEPLNLAVARFNERTGPARACAPRGDVGPDPGSHSGKWLTSVMLAYRPEVVKLRAADARLRAELTEADPDTGRALLERYVSSIVEQTRTQRHGRASRPGAPPPR